ncbi:putative PurR-regulated permease PerM [Thermocatellispora tengchongensis]|uniref:Putative PurR-regulated permease PerM n=1 Tax=Thermocatellispora tengchongensis TaxID=1073253 RepID=A0A840PQR2_9ACTN|nr:AI-2E family transporter [Thermocatellispora tengchongensis]MBB5138325.1 putative PurR-regulated permease PerM [Thermocatellispora tengchongensis]
MLQPQVPRALVVLLGAAAAVVTLAGIRSVASIAGPVVLALVLVIAVAPIRGWLAARRAPGWLLVAAPLLVVLLVLLAMVAILTVSVAQLAALIPTYSQQFTDLADQAERLAAGFGVGTEQIDQALSAFNPAQLLDLAQGLFTGLLGVLSSLFLIVVLLLAMCLDAAGFSRLMSSGTGHRPALVEALAEFSRKTRRYLVVSTVFGLICAVLDIAALYALSVPLPLLWGILALITNYIPNIGFIIGLAPPALLGLLDGGVRTMMLVIVAYVAINVVIQSFIQPKFLGDAVGLSTTVTLLSLILWAFVLGPIGALLAIPLSLLTRALLIDSDPSAKWAAALVSGRPPGDGDGRREPEAPAKTPPKTPERPATPTTTKAAPSGGRARPEA